jgi:hypothetical protein
MSWRSLMVDSGTLGTMPPDVEQLAVDLQAVSHWLLAERPPAGRASPQKGSKCEKLSPERRVEASAAGLHALAF